MKDLVSGYLDRSTLPNEVEPLKDIIGVLSQALLKLWEEVDALKADNALLREENAVLRSENAQLRAENAVLRAENAELRRENAELRAHNEILQAEVTLLKHKIFGSGKGSPKKKTLRAKTHPPTPIRIRKRTLGGRPPGRIYLGTAMFMIFLSMRKHAPSVGEG